MLSEILGFCGNGLIDSSKKNKDLKRCQKTEQNKTNQNKTTKLGLIKVPKTQYSNFSVIKDKNKLLHSVNIEFSRNKNS